LQLATVLLLVVGIVNATGFLEIHQLTTNVTGHFALLYGRPCQFGYIELSQLFFPKMGASQNVVFSREKVCHTVPYYFLKPR